MGRLPYGVVSRQESRLASFGCKPLDTSVEHRVATRAEKPPALY